MKSKGFKQGGKGNGKGKRGRTAKDKKEGAAAVVKTEKKPKAKQARADPAKQLDMTLEDIVNSQGKRKGKAAAKEEGGETKPKAKGKAKAKAGKLWGGAAKVMTTRRKGNGKGKDSWGQGKDAWGGKGGARAKRNEWDSWGGKGKDAWGGGGKGKRNEWDSWGAKGGGKNNRRWESEESFGGKGGKRGGKGDSWGGKGREEPAWGKGKSRGEERWERVRDYTPPRREARDPWGAPRSDVRERPPAREPRAPTRDREWLAQKDKEWGPPPREGGRYGESSRPSARAPRELGGVARGMGQKRSHEEDRFDSRPAGPAGSSKKIKVTNIPRDLDMQDIKEAFESEAGKISLCKMERGTAWITFLNPKDARKAVDTFDRGELNGKTIDVVFER